MAASDSVDQRLKLRFVVEAVDAEQFLSLVVIRFQLVIAERPGEALVRWVRLEFVGTEAQERRPIPFGLAADVVVLVRDEDPIVAVDPEVVVLEPTHLEDLLNVKGAAVARQTITPFQDQRPLARAYQIERRGRTAGAGAYNDGVVVLIGHLRSSVGGSIDFSAATLCSGAGHCELGQRLATRLIRRSQTWVEVRRNSRAR